MNRKKKTLSLLTAIYIFIGVNITPAYATQVISPTPNFTYDRIVASNDADINSGSYSGAHFIKSYYLKNTAGSYVNFWIKNTGNISVTITINGENGRTFAPGESGHISTSVDSSGETYNFEAVSTSSGKYINIEFRIAQRDH